MTGLVDANALIRHLAGDPPEHARPVTAFLARARRVWLADLIVAEVVYVLQSVFTDADLAVSARRSRIGAVVSFDRLFQRLPTIRRIEPRAIPTRRRSSGRSADCDWLGPHGGYTSVKNDKLQGHPRDFDPVRGLDTGELHTFLGATQIDAWNDLVKRYGGDADVAQGEFADRLANELDRRGTVDVLRHGVIDQGVNPRLAYFRSQHRAARGAAVRDPRPAQHAVRQRPGRRGPALPEHA